MSVPSVAFWESNPELKNYFGNQSSFSHWLSFRKDLLNLVELCKLDALEKILEGKKVSPCVYVPKRKVV
jgi:hypothetical protein